MNPRWYEEAVIYCLDVSAFQDSNDDGVGDLRGLLSRLDYLARLGVTCLWLNPIHPSPQRDAGYDVADYYGVDPSLGSLGDFAELTRRARERGIRIILDLVVNHTSDQHPWFVSARSDPRAPHWRATPLAYSHALGDERVPAICGVMPGIVGAPFSGSVGPPLAKNQSNTDCIAAAVGVGVAVPGPLMLGPR